MPKVLVLTNDFPPRPGGIQFFVHALAMRLPPESVVVYAPAWEGAARFDAALPFPVVRHPTSLMLPVPSVARRAQEVVKAEGCDTVVFGAAAPLGLLAPGLRRAGVKRLIALTHGHEVGWAALPAARAILRRIGDSVDTVTYLGDYTRVRLARALSPAAAARMTRLTPGVDTSEFCPGAGGKAVRERLGLGDRPVVVCVSRMVPRKGQDTLIHAWPLVLATTPDATLLLVGDGPYRGRLERMARHLGVDGSVVFTGAPSRAELPGYFDAGNVFAMPCRTRRRGLDVEGLGMVFLEAAATGLPVVGGDSGNSADAIRNGETGYVVPGVSVADLADRLKRLLTDPCAAKVMGEKGLAWVQQEWRWEIIAQRFGEILAGSEPPAPHEAAARGKAPRSRPRSPSRSGSGAPSARGSGSRSAR
jgi:phosphatidylinositol alpha-1,6-mannosyltransferase